MREALGRAAGGDWRPLQDQADTIRSLVGKQILVVPPLPDMVMSLRGALYPLLARESADRENLVTLLLGLDQSIAWFLHHVSGAEGTTLIDVERDALFLRSIVENIPYMIFVKDARDLRFVRFNKAGEQLLGYTREDS